MTAGNNAMTRGTEEGVGNDVGGEIWGEVGGALEAIGTGAIMCCRSCWRALSYHRIQEAILGREYDDIRCKYDTTP